MIRNETTAFRKSPYRNLLPLTVKLKAEKSGFLTTAAISGVSKSLTKALHDRAKGRADHHADRQIDDVSPQQKLFEPPISCLRTISLSCPKRMPVIFRLPRKKPALPNPMPKATVLCSSRIRFENNDRLRQDFSAPGVAPTICLRPPTR